MRTVEQLTESIIQLTTQIEVNYPELYKFLDENVFPANGAPPTVNELEKYLETLKQQLRHHLLTHQTITN